MGLKTGKRKKGGRGSPGPGTYVVPSDFGVYQFVPKPKPNPRTFKFTFSK